MATIVMLVHEERGRFGASFPDFPGCTTVAATLDALIAKAPEVLAFHVEGVTEDGGPAAAPRSLGEWRRDPGFVADAVDATVVLMPYEPRTRTVRVNITMDEGMLSRIDRAAEAVGESRSGFLVSAARTRLAAALGAEEPPRPPV